MQAMLAMPTITEIKKFIIKKTTKWLTKVENISIKNKTKVEYNKAFLLPKLSAMYPAEYPPKKKLNLKPI